jgi:hypothetical protein
MVWTAAFGATIGFVFGVALIIAYRSVQRCASIKKTYRFKSLTKSELKSQVNSLNSREDYSTNDYYNG